MSKNRIDLIPFSVYFRDGSHITIKMSALSNGGDIHRQLVSMLRKSKIRENDPLLQYYSICSVTGENSIERLLLPHEHIWGITQQFKEKDRLEFCRFIYPPSNQKSKKYTSSTPKKMNLEYSSTSSDDNSDQIRKFLSDSEAHAKKRILPSNLSDQEKKGNEKTFSGRSSSHKDDLAAQKSDPLEIWSDFIENNYLFSDCPIYKPEKEEFLRLFSLYIYVILKQRKIKESDCKDAIKDLVQIALPTRYHSMMKCSKLVDQIYLLCKEYYMVKRTEEDAMKLFNKVFKKSWKYYGVRLFFDCRIEDKKIISSNKQVIVGINEDGIIIMKKDGEIISLYPLNQINDFYSSQHTFTVCIEKDKGPDQYMQINIHTSQSVTMEYVLQAYLDRYVNHIFSQIEPLKNIKGSFPMLQLIQYPTSPQNKTDFKKTDLTEKLTKKKKKKIKERVRRRASSMTSKRNIDIEVRPKKSFDDTFNL